MYQQSPGGSGKVCNLLAADQEAISMNTIIQTIGLTKVFRTEEVETKALQEVNLEVKKGEFLAVMGPSGCGKSTLLNILGLLDQPTDGAYYFMGNDITGYGEKRRARLRKKNIGFVFQNFNLIEELTVSENVELPLVYLGLSTTDRRKRVDEVLEELHITHRSKHFPNQLSGGVQQRVAVARALVSRPRIILADEPTGNLDSVAGDEVMTILEELNRSGATVIIVTHSHRDAEFAHRIVRLFDGQIINEDIRHRNL